MASWCHKTVQEIDLGIRLCHDFRQYLTPLSCVLLTDNHHLFDQQRFLKYQLCAGSKSECWR